MIHPNPGITDFLRSTCSREEVKSITLIISVVAFSLTLAWNYFVADFWGNFGGPDNLPPPGFEKVFMAGAAKAAPVYIVCLVGTIASSVGIARNRKTKALREQHAGQVSSEDAPSASSDEPSA